jgi:hypothetical protein
MVKKVYYDQEQINTNLENTFDVEPTNNNQAAIKKGRGGKRAGAGRKVGSTNKIQGVEFLEEYKKVHGSSLKEDLARDMFQARVTGNFELLFRYQTAFAKYYFSDVAAQDITTKGQSLSTVFNFPTVELKDWK